MVLDPLPWRSHLRAAALFALLAVAALWKPCLLGEVPYDLPRQESLRPWADAPVARPPASPETAAAMRPAPDRDVMDRYRAWWQHYLAGDQVVTVWPDHVMVREQVRSGNVPWWQPRGLAGMPLLVTTASSPLSPLTWPSYLLPLVRGRALTLALHLLLAGYGLWILLRRHGRSEAASLAGGAAFMLNPLFAAWLPFGDTVPVFGLAPFALLAVDLAARSREPWRPAAALGIVTAVQLLGGNPQQGLLAVALQSLYALTVRPPTDDTDTLPRRGAFLGWCALATVLGVIAAAVQLLPFAEMAGLTARPDDRYRDTNFLPLTSLLTLAFPRLFGHPAHGDYVGGYLYDRPFFSLLGPGPGPVLVGLALAGALSRRSRRALTAVVAVTALLCLTALTPLHRALAAALPFFDGLDALRGLGVAYLGLAWLCADGVDALLEARAQRTLRWWPVALIVLAVALDLVGRVGDQRLAWHLRSLSRPSLLLAPRVLLPIAFTGVAAALAHYASRKEKLTPLAPFIVAAMVACEVLALAWPTIPSAPAERVLRETNTSRAIGERLRRHAPIRMTGLTEPDTFPPYDGDNLPPNTAAALGFDDLRACSRLPPSPIAELLQSIAPLSFPTIAPGGDLDRPLFDLLDLGYVLSRHPLPPAHYREVAPGIFANRHPRARAFFTRCSTVIADGDARVRHLTSTEFRPFAQAVLSARVPGVAECDGDPEPVIASVRYPAPDRVDIEVVASGNGILVLADAWFPGWTAAVDGAETDVLRVDHALRGVALGAGRHHVSMRFHPTSVRDGYWLTLAAALCLAALAYGRRPPVSDDALVAVGASVFLLAFASRAPLPNDNDCLYADVIRALRHGGSWIRLNIHGVHFLDKPPLFFLAGAAVTAVFGESDLALRLVPIASGVGCAVIASRMTRRLSGSRRAALLAPVILLTAPLFFEYSRRVYMEVPTALAVIASLDLGLRKRWALAGLVAGMGFMLKTIPGGLGLAGALVAVAATERRLPWKEALVSAAVFAAVVVPWHAAAFAAQPGPMMDFTFRLHVRDQVMSAQPWSTGGPLFYPVHLATHDPLMGLAMLAALVEGARRWRDGDRPLGTISIALALQLVLYTVISTKKDLYLLTAFPVAAVGASVALAPWLAAERARVVLVAALTSLQFTALGRDHFAPEPTQSAEGWIAPLARRFAEIAPPDAVLHVKDTYFAAPQFYARHRADYAVSNAAVIDLVWRIPYIRAGRLVRRWEDSLLDQGGWALVRSEDGGELLRRRPDVRVVGRNLAFWLVQGPP